MSLILGLEPEQPDLPPAEAAVVLIDTDTVVPLTQDMWNCHCSACDKPQAKWAVKTPESAFEAAKTMCSLCLLYETPWGKESARNIEKLIEGVEKDSKENFFRDPRNKLLSCQVADRVMASIAMVSRMKFLMGRKGG